MDSTPGALTPPPKSGEEEEEPAEPESIVDTMKQKQLLAVEELLSTERSYLRMLQLCAVVIRGHLKQLQPPLGNVEGVFSNVDDVIEVSSCLLSLLEQKEPTDPEFLSALCSAFLSLREDMEMVYREYCASYNTIVAMETSFRQREGLWQAVVNTIKTSAPDVNATSLTFFLVMPVQRIARYPLLLQTMLKHTDAQHPAAPALRQAAEAAVALNCRINEYKRVREVADKYKRTENLTIRDKISRLSGHSIAKKTARMSQMIKHETGIKPKIRDEEFDILEGYFCVLEKGIIELHENVGAYLRHLQNYLSFRPEERELELDHVRAARCYKEVAAPLRQWMYPAFEGRLQALVYRPLCALRELLAGPRNLIRKRLHKLLDYELLEEKQSLSYEDEAVANTYRTLNALLLAELPKFTATTLQLLWGVLGAFSCIHRDLAEDVAQLAGGYLPQLPHSQLEPSAFWQWAEESVLQGAESMERLCRSVAEELNDPVVQPLSPSFQKRLKVLTDKHGVGRIYQLTGNVGGTRELDLTLQRGDLVAVLGEMDTRGDRRRWLVDAAGRRGYVPASKLTPYHQATQASSSSPSPASLPQHLAPAMGGAEFRRHSFSPATQPIVIRTPPCLQVCAGYDFAARGHHEVSLQAGEPVRVLEPHDKRGNPEWSLVEVRGQRGYVPSNYLTVQLPGPAIQPAPPAT
uniref:Rho guanine nucleotide exchange factor 37 n=1 Tax=Lepisosteus oculatus TaxID=7918 RepID=W5N308_LEPOC|nr:PREDICTED: rho guanine nucleotide exchange factor 37 isoform X2 [Lepisosteus oculatus]